VYTIVYTTIRLIRYVLVRYLSAVYDALSQWLLLQIPVYTLILRHSPADLLARDSRLLFGVYIFTNLRFKALEGSVNSKTSLIMSHTPSALADEECRSILDTYLSHNFGDNESICEKMVKALEVDEQELAAQSSYAYWLASTRDSTPLPEDFRVRTAMREAARHLNWSGKFGFALTCLKKSIAFRKAQKVEIYRTCLQEDFVYNSREDYKLAARRRHRILQGVIEQPIVVRGHDRENNAVLLVLPREHKGKCKETFIDVIIYMIERAVACSEMISRGKSEKIVVVLDANNSKAPCFNALKAAVSILQNHYPHRLKNLAILDSPAWLVGAYNLLKPFLDQNTRKKFIVAKGEKQKEASLNVLLEEAQAMPSMLVKGKLTSPVDIKRFLEDVPFGSLYDSIYLAPAQDVSH
jgi:hypothetical protein